MDKEVTFTCENAKINTDLLYSMLSAEQCIELIKWQNKNIKQLKEEKEKYAKALTSCEKAYASALAELKEVSKQLESFTDHYRTAEDMLKKREELASNVGKLVVEMEKMKQRAITIDMVERAAYDIIQDYVRELDNNGHVPSRYALSEKHAFVTVITTRMVERVKQYLRNSK